MSSPLPTYNALTSSARPILPQKELTPKYDSWQSQLWDYYDRLGEFESAVSWRANSMSRIRLIAAELNDNGDEPTLVDEGPAADAMTRLAGGTGGQSQLMREMVIHLSVPGEGWLIGENDDDNGERWFVASADELRVSERADGFEFRVGEDRNAWRQLSSDSMVIRFWDPHPRFGWRADSDAHHAMDAMLELDLVNKRIVAEILSRLASNGILLYDKGKLSFPSSHQSPDGADQVDPFAEILVDVAGRGIQDPTSPEATIPIPIGFELGDLTGVDPSALLQHVSFANIVSEKLLSQRESAIKRMATSLDMPPEVLLGVSGMNHWGAWQVEETGIKVHIAPKAELITHSLTTGYLIPALKEAGAPLTGPNGGRLVVWYDPSEITVRPDRSANVLEAYKLGEVPGRVLRREIGLNEESDGMQEGEFAEWITTFLARQPETAPAILQEYGTTLAPSPLDATAQESETGETENVDATEPPTSSVGPPPTRDDEQPLSDDFDVQALDGANLVDLAARVESELLKRRGATSIWLEADMPISTRVTPERRDSHSGGNGNGKVPAVPGR